MNVAHAGERRLNTYVEIVALLLRERPREMGLWWTEQRHIQIIHVQYVDMWDK